MTNVIQTSNSGLTQYGEAERLREYIRTFKAGLGTKSASEAEYTALAHLSHSHGLDPFNGEAWIIPGNGVMVGIKGLRKLANRQSRQDGYRWWTEFHDIRNNEEAANYGVPENAELAVLCQLRRSDQIEAYGESLAALRKSLPDVPWEVLQEMIGRPPVITGIGYVVANERSKMPKGQLVKKRAEAHALKQAFDVPFLGEGVSFEGNGGSDGATEYADMPPASDVLYPEDNPFDDIAEGEVAFDDWPFRFQDVVKLSAFNPADWKDFHSKGPDYCGVDREMFVVRYRARYGVESGKDIEATAAEVFAVVAMSDAEWSA